MFVYIIYIIKETVKCIQEHCERGRSIEIARMSKNHIRAHARNEESTYENEVYVNGREMNKTQTNLYTYTQTKRSRLFNAKIKKHT